MLHEKELPKKLWAEAANTSVYLLNKMPTRALQEKKLRLKPGLDTN